MSTSLTVQASARPADVRDWLATNGFTPGSRGKFSAEQIAAYNRNNGLKYKPAAYVPVKAVVTRDKRGKKVTRKVNVAQARAILAASGAQVGRRGRLSEAQLQHALSL